MRDLMGGWGYKSDMYRLILLTMCCLGLSSNLLLATPGSPVVITGKVVSVHDGDTVTILVPTNQQVKIRLAEIDAPEKGQAFGNKSKLALSDKVAGKTVMIQVVDKDRYGRSVGNIHLGDRWINLEMVQEGWAWMYRQYSKSVVMESAEKQARTEGLGLWADKNPIPPWEYRHPAHTEPFSKEESPVPLIKVEW
jgi:micrococcal nuclease